MLFSNENMKAKSYWSKCYDVAHINPSNCVRRYTLYLGTHWRKEYTVFNHCQWCGLERGTHQCNKVNLTRLFAICPIWRFVRHFAKDCSPQFIIMSKIFGPLINRKRNRRTARRRRMAGNRRFRRYFRLRRRRRWKIDCYKFEFKLYHLYLLIIFAIKFKCKNNNKSSYISKREKNIITITNSLIGISFTSVSFHNVFYQS